MRAYNTVLPQGIFLRSAILQNRFIICKRQGKMNIRKSETNGEKLDQVCLQEIKKKREKIKMKRALQVLLGTYCLQLAQHWCIWQSSQSRKKERKNRKKWGGVSVIIVFPTHSARTRKGMVMMGNSHKGPLLVIPQKLQKKVAAQVWLVWKQTKKFKKPILGQHTRTGGAYWPMKWFSAAATTVLGTYLINEACFEGRFFFFESFQCSRFDSYSR